MEIIDRFFTARKGSSWLFRLPVSWKYLLTTTLLIALVLDKSWLPQLLFVLLSIGLYFSAGLGRELRTNLLLMALPGVLVVLYHGIFSDWLTGIGLAGVFFSSLSLGRLMFLTTELPLLMAAMTVYLRPLAVLRVRPEMVALAMYLMIRSIPWLFVAGGEVVQAHRARGIKIRIRTLFIPTIIAAVGHARETADALHSRNLV